MKIAKAIRDTYNSAKSEYDRLSDEVRSTIESAVLARGWFFTSRLKELESFALKIETGRVENPRRMEDFFACTIIVPTLLQVASAEAFLEEYYETIARRPKSDEITHKKSSDFVFDDLRLYLKLRESISGRNDNLHDIVFEVQIKTILQYAWGIASHDLIYKTDNVSWPKERIAFQVKAMLEHAEIAIASAERLADSPATSKIDQQTADIIKIIFLIRKFWMPEHLPKDIKRLAESILLVAKACDLKADAIESVLITEKRRIGLLPANLSPYAFLIQAVAHSENIDLQAKLSSSRNRKMKILIHADMDLPEWMRKSNEKIISL